MFDANPSLDVRGVFLDSSKAFDRVWHDGLMYKELKGIKVSVETTTGCYIHSWVIDTKK